MDLEQLFSEFTAQVRALYEVDEPDNEVECASIVFTKEGVACWVELTKNNGVNYAYIRYSIRLVSVFRLDPRSEDLYPDLEPRGVQGDSLLLYPTNCLEYAMEAIGRARGKVTAVMNTWFADVIEGKLCHPSCKEEYERFKREAYYCCKPCKSCGLSTDTSLVGCECYLCILCHNKSPMVPFSPPEVLEGMGHLAPEVVCRFCGEQTRGHIYIASQD